MPNAGCALLACRAKWSLFKTGLQEDRRRRRAGGPCARAQPPAQPSIASTRVLIARRSLSLWSTPLTPVPCRSAHQVSELPSSPAELLRYLTSAEYKRAQQETWDRVRGSYQVRAGHIACHRVVLSHLPEGGMPRI